MGAPSHLVTVDQKRIRMNVFQEFCDDLQLLIKHEFTTLSTRDKTAVKAMGISAPNEVKTVPLPGKEVTSIFEGIHRVQGSQTI